MDGRTGAATPLTPARLRRAAATLTATDRRLGAMVREDGSPPMWGRRAGFATLVRIILEQQVTGSSGAAAYRRLSATVGRVTPRRVLAHSHARLARMGLTRQKARYCLELARAVTSGDLDVTGLHGAAPDDVRRELTRVPGIGRWTVDVYLLMALRHPDVWPRGDLALDTQVRRLRGRADDGPEALAAFARRWRPWRSVAARILWHHCLRSRRNGIEA
jgi:DNA-3-methyladenine glycosylase II